MFGLKKNNKQAYKALQNINFDDFKNYLCSYSDDDILLTPTGWQKIGGAWYYMNSSGVMQHDRWVGNYYVNSSGKWVKSR